jgi:hypothetical protein
LSSCEAKKKEKEFSRKGEERKREMSHRKLLSLERAF